MLVQDATVNRSMIEETAVRALERRCGLKVVFMMMFLFVRVCVVVFYFDCECVVGLSALHCNYAKVLINC